uniref:NodB homology domain-containing protein n=1 Tax=Thermosporothrix sp. COM3 TaxID=2490863 RepID=A0A455SST1_9CHLR|nr:hypothetical protein KTC_61680 [Thermosporothrix sp. COM3]
MSAHGRDNNHKPSFRFNKKLHLPIILLAILSASLWAVGSFAAGIAAAEDEKNRALTITPTPGPSPTIVFTPTPTPTIEPTPSPTITGDSTPIGNPGNIPNVITNGSRNRLEIALTFDDGPHPQYTPQVLQILKRYNIKATFFCLGQMIQENPDLVRQEHQAGHVVASHSWSHPDLTTLSMDQLQKELKNTSDLIYNTIGERPTLVRPPYGSYNNNVVQVANSLSEKIIIWDVDTNDWQRKGVDSIVNTAFQEAGKGSIILMHDAGGERSQTIAALPRIIEGLKARGYSFVTVPELLSHMG